MTEKKIKKDKKYRDFACQQTQKLMAVASEQVEETKKEAWSGLMAKIFTEGGASAQLDEAAVAKDYASMTVQQIRTSLIA